MPNAFSEHRASGVLLHVSSLPTAYGIGDLGPGALAFVDRLAKAQVGIWQILPMNLPAHGGAPYSACSAFAGNVYLISPESLFDDELIDEAELRGLRRKASSRVDFADVRKSRDAMLASVAERFANRKVDRKLLDAFDAFCKAEGGWLDDFALFMALREQHDHLPWSRWPKRIARRDPSALEAIRSIVEPAMHRGRVAQFLFFRQLDALREHATKSGVKLLGDVPIYVAHDSADVWANRELFQLNAQLEPTNVAGAPPDPFSDLGQMWGNPLYNWRALADQKFAWWVARMRAMLKQADVIRLDHFRALAAYWSIPANAPDARSGKWIDGPGEALLVALRDALGGLPLVAEDLGIITADVVALRKRFDLAGMQVLQFALGAPPDDVPEAPAWPHAMPGDVLVYTGNHDTDTTLGWWNTLRTTAKKCAIAYAPEMEASPVWGLIRLAWMSAADVAIVPVQDLLELGSDARMNAPGTTGDNNWSWRLEKFGDLDRALKKLATFNTMYQRAGL